MTKLENFLSTYEPMTIEVAPGVRYNLRDEINESYRLFNSKFKDGELEASGFKRIFYNMIWVIFRTIIMSSDVDLKDLNLRSLNGKGIKLIFLLKMAVHSHLGRTFFGKYVDKVMAEMVWFGSSITKRSNGSVETVDLRNYTTEPTIKDPQSRRHAETCYYSYQKMLSYKDEWKDKWEDIEQIWTSMQKEGKSLFKIVDFWTWNDEGRKVCQRYLITAMDNPESSPDPQNDGPYVLLDEFITPYKRERVSRREIKKLGKYEDMFPYEQADLFEAPGRWLAFGCCTLLKGLNEHYQEYTNDKRKKDILDLKGIFVHKYSSSTNSLTQEFLNNLDTGDVVQMSEDEDLQRLVIDTKTQEYIANVDKLYEIMRLVVGVTAQGTGEEMPSSTSATQASINAQTSMTTYDFVRERMHHFLVGLMQNGYFEDIIDEITEEQITAIVGDPVQLEELDAFFIDQQLNREAINWKQQTGAYPTEEEYEAEKQRLMEEHRAMQDMRFPEIKKEILKGINYFVEFYVTNEPFDKKTTLETLINMKNDPNSTKNKEAIEDQIFDLMNMNPRQYDATPEQRQMRAELQRQQMMQQMGIQQPQEELGGITNNTMPV